MRDEISQKRDADRYKTLLSIGQSLITITDLDLLLKKIIDVLAKEIQSERALILLRHPITGEMRVANATANVDTSTLEDAMLFSRTIVTDVVNKGKSIFSRDVIKDSAYSKTDSVMNLKIRSLMCVPLVAKQNADIIGTVYVDNRSVGNIFSKEDLTLLESFANFAAMAIENAHLYELAIIDELTKCYVRRYFEQRVREEFSRAVRQKSALSLLMIDVDQFKEVNDRYGHPAGDLVLKEIAATIKRNLRTYDLVARIGGDEFAVILPEVGFQDSYRVAEKIRNTAAQLLFPGIQFKVTISIGIACYPLHHVSNVESLMKKADVALYKAKQLGRNNCFFYGQQEMLDLLGEVALESPVPSNLKITDLLDKIESRSKGDTTEEIDFLIGKSIDLLKDVQEQISQLKTMAVQMNSQIHQLDPHSNKVKDLIEMLQKLTGKHDEIEYALRDYYQMIKDLPVRNE
ncbi:MAG TPA: sensor domain-containing diguanylate cyclase [Acidobacteriota bacterium]|nr:sensor domain-containing diguanylate cyclase [Acidobacteriota bacterium]